MILELPKFTKEQYAKAKEEFYKKPGIPDIELELEEYQKELLLKGNFGILPQFHKTLSIYSKSLLLQRLSVTGDYIEPEKVDELSDMAADNFIKRYFRTENPIVGASFAGILQFKVKEVLSIYFKSSAIESNVSLDTEVGNASSNNTLTVEQILAYKNYTEGTTEDLDPQTTYEDCVDDIFLKIQDECKLLQQINLNKNLNSYFLQYLIYLYILQSSRLEKKLNTISGQAVKLILDDEKSINSILPILESSLLDISEKSVA